MISELALDTADELAAQLETEGRRMTAAPGTALYDLCKSNISLKTELSLEHSVEVGFDPARIIEDSRVREGGTHADVIEHLANLAGKLIDGNLALVRGSVIPIAGQLLDEYDRLMGEMHASEAFPVEIVPNIWDPIWSNAQLKDMIRRYERIQERGFKNTNHFPEATVEELRTMIGIGSPSTDDLLNVWAERFTDERLKEVYETVFRSSMKADMDLSTGGRHITLDGLTRDDLLLAWMYARRIPDVVKGMSSMSLSAMRNACSRIEHSLGHGLFKEYEKRALIKSAKTLVFGVQKEKKTSILRGTITRYRVYVNNDVYLKWLEEGGTPEILFGAVLKDKRMEYGALLAEAEALSDAWKRFIDEWQLLDQTNEINMRRGAIDRAFKTLLPHLDKDEHKIDYEDEVLCERFKKELSKTSSMLLRNDRLLCRRIVARVMYPGTSASYILDAMSELGEKGTTTDARSAAALVAFDLYARWCAGQMTQLKL